MLAASTQRRLKLGIRLAKLRNRGRGRLAQPKKKQGLEAEAKSAAQLVSKIGWRHRVAGLIGDASQA
jgi:hypothetical protein